MTYGNTESFMRQYPSLLPKNFLGNIRLWDAQLPLVTGRIFPQRGNENWNFQWRIQIEPNDMAPSVGDGSKTPMSDHKYKYEQFVHKEYRNGFTVLEREVKFGLPNVISSRTRGIVNSMKLAMEYIAVESLIGTYYANTSMQATTFARQQSLTLGAGAQWDMPGSDPVGDILHVKTGVAKMCGERVRDMLIGFNEEEYLHNHPNILDQLKYTDGNLLVSGRITTIKGLNMLTVQGFYKLKAALAEYGETGNLNEDTYNYPSAAGTLIKRFLLEDYAILVAPNLGWISVAEQLTNRQWHDIDTRRFFYQIYKSVVPVVDDAGRIGLIKNTDSQSLRSGT